jgi:hypothetical protein
MNPNFFKYIGEHLRTYPQFILSRVVLKEIQERTLVRLGMTDMGQLRDRFEGQAFYSDMVKKIGSLYACHNYLGMDKPVLSERMFIDFKPEILIAGVKHKILTFNYGECPELEAGESKLPIIFVVQKNENTFSVAGTADMQTLDKNPNFIFVKSGNRTEFIGFDELKRLY